MKLQRRWETAVWFILPIVCVIARVALAAPSTQPVAVQTSVPDITVVEQQIKSGQLDLAIASIREVAADHPDFMGSWMGTLAKPLFDHKCYKELDEFAPAATAASGNSPTFETMILELQVRSLLQLKRYSQALAAAKALYNVSNMDRTSDAVLLLADVLKAAHPDDPEIPERFMLQQLQGAILPDAATTKPVQDSGAPVLAAIHVDGARYDARLRELTAATYTALATRGNLLLLADRPREAMEEFKKAYPLATNAQLAEATENIARAMKAEDGTVGRANGWMLSVYPRPTATTRG